MPTCLFAEPTDQQPISSGNKLQYKQVVYFNAMSNVRKSRITVETPNLD